MDQPGTQQHTFKLRNLEQKKNSLSATHMLDLLVAYGAMHKSFDILKQFDVDRANIQRLIDVTTRCSNRGSNVDPATKTEPKF